MTPEPSQLKRSNHNLWMHELVNGYEDGNVPGSPVSVAWVVLGPGESTDTHRHDDSWAYVVVLDAGAEGAITQLGDKMDQFVVQHPRQILVLPPGLVHRARNTSSTDWVTGFEFRTCKSVFDDRIKMAELNGIDIIVPSPSRKDRVAVPFPGLPAPVAR